MYTFLAGPALWAAFIIFLGGLIFRIARLYRLSRKKDHVFYNHIDLKWGAKSIFRWIIPWSSASMRSHPLFTLMVFSFHISLIIVPLFLNAHNILWNEKFGINLFSIPNTLADVFTLVLIGSGLYLFMRRIIRPEVRILTGIRDYVLLILTMLPFITGFLAYHQIGKYEFMMLFHIISSETLLIIIPFSKLSHVVLFFFTRAFIGFEMGGRRGARSW